MELTIAILEDDPDLVQEMRDALDRYHLADRARFFSSAFEMIDWLKDHLEQLQLVSLDHDLSYIPGSGGKLIDPGEGRDVSRYLATCKPCCAVVIHTTNTPGAVSMTWELQDVGWQTIRVFPVPGTPWVEDLWLPAVVETLRAAKH